MESKPTVPFDCEIIDLKDFSKDPALNAKEEEINV